MNDGSAALRGRGSGSWGAAVTGGVVGALLMAALLIFAAPNYLATRIVRHGLLADPAILSDTVDALRDAQYAPVLADNRTAIETPFASSWKGAAKPEVTLVEFYDYACPYCKASNPSVDRLLSEDKGLRVVYRELPILGPNSVTAARLSLAASKLGRFPQFHDALWAAGRPSPRDHCARRSRSRDPDRSAGWRRCGSGAQAEFRACRKAWRDRNPGVHRRQQGDERGGRLRRAQAGDRRSPREKLKRCSLAARQFGGELCAQVPILVVDFRRLALVQMSERNQRAGALPVACQHR